MWKCQIIAADKEMWLIVEVSSQQVPPQSSFTKQQINHKTAPVQAIKITPDIFPF